MVLGQILKVGSVIFKYRKQIYAVVTAQDRYIKGAFVGTRVSKAAQYGWRSGAAIGGFYGAFNNQAPDTPGNGQIPSFTKSPTGTQNKTRNRFSTRSRTRNNYRCKPYQKRRRTRSR